MRFGMALSRLLAFFSCVGKRKVYKVRLHVKTKMYWYQWDGLQPPRASYLQISLADLPWTSDQMVISFIYFSL